ncbi:MAG: flagellar biosynthesis protein FlhF [Steroidobacteraceae bacterium]
MKIKVYSARDMRTALKMVREEQGPDAVILSTRTGPQGVEVEVATDPAEASAIFRQPKFAQAAAAAAMAEVSPPVAEPAPVSPSFAELLIRGPVQEAPIAEAPRAEVVVPLAPVATVSALPLVDAPRIEADLNAEIRSMRHLLESQLSRLAWNDLTRRSPAQAELLKQLTELGLAEDLSLQLVSELPEQISFDDAQRRTLAQLARRIVVTGDDLLDQGGRVALVGPTGVGKTTVIAKLAARWVMRHGARDLALVSTDSQRFGAHEQLRTLGRLLGVEAFCLDDSAQLPDLLSRLGSRRLVLIDTAGQSPRDAELAARANQFAALAERHAVKFWLTLSSGAQAGVLADAIARFGVFSPACCVLTKLDEATSLGGTLSALVKHQLPVSYVSDGQRIPEDLNPARAHQLVSRAVQLTRIAGATAGEDLLTRRFGGNAHGIA